MTRDESNGLTASVLDGDEVQGVLSGAFYAADARSEAAPQARATRDNPLNGRLALRRTIVRHHDLGIFGGESLAPQSRQAQLQSRQIVIVRNDHADFHGRAFMDRRHALVVWRGTRDMVAS